MNTQQYPFLSKIGSPAELRELDEDQLVDVADECMGMRMIKSPNGEDVLYIFHHRLEGRSVLLPYNMIRKELQNPIHCHGNCLFEDGKMIVFRSTGPEPTRVHPMQVWQTPFTSAEHAAKAPTSGSYLEKIGNADLVRGISDMLSIRRSIEAMTRSSEWPRTPTSRRIRGTTASRGRPASRACCGNGFRRPSCMT